MDATAEEWLLARCVPIEEVFEKSVVDAAAVDKKRQPEQRLPWAVIGDEAARRWGVQVGDLVGVEPGFNCGRCKTCLEGGRCSVAPASYGYTSTQIEPSLWGGYAEYLYLAPGTIVHKFPADTPPSLAALYNAIGAGFDWAQATPNLSVGQSIAILRVFERIELFNSPPCLTSRCSSEGRQGQERATSRI